MSKRRILGLIGRSTDYLCKIQVWKRFFPNHDIHICLINMKHSWTKNAFRNVNNNKWRKWCNFVTPFLFNNTYGLPVLTMENKCPNQLIHVWLFDLQTICAKYKAGNLILPNNDIRLCLLDMKNSWTKKAFWDLTNKKWRNLCMFV
jgi:hypothetical protein